jgi:hypothetical protein
MKSCALSVASPARGKPRGQHVTFSEWVETREECGLQAQRPHDPHAEAGAVPTSRTSRKWEQGVFFGHD